MLPRLQLVALTGALALMGGGQVRAEEPAQGAAVVTPLGAEASAVTYWVDEPEGFRVVTTVETGGTGHAVVRLSTILRPGQTQTVSVPGPAGSPAHAMRISRRVAGIEVLAAGPESRTD